MCTGSGVASWLADFSKKNWEWTPREQYLYIGRDRQRPVLTMKSDSRRNTKQPCHRAVGGLEGQAAARVTGLHDALRVVSIHQIITRCRRQPALRSSFTTFHFSPGVRTLAIRGYSGLGSAASSAMATGSYRFGVGIDAEFVVAAPDVLHECVACAAHTSGPVPFQPTHRSHSDLELAMIRSNGNVCLLYPLRRSSATISDDPSGCRYHPSWFPRDRWRSGASDVCDH